MPSKHKVGDSNSSRVKKRGVMSVVDEIKAKYFYYPIGFIDKKIEEWKFRHPGEDLEGLRKYLKPGSQGFEIKPCFICNEKCIHCFNGEDERRVKTPTLEELYRHLDTMTTEESVCVIGGEPTMRDDLAEILKYIKAKGKQTNLHTNGLRLADEKYLEKLIPYIDIITFPIHSSDYDVFDSITRVKGSAEKSITVFKKLVQIDGIIVGTQTVINQLNYKTLLETFDMIQNISIVRMMLTFPHPVGAAYTTSVTPRYSEIKSYVQTVLKKYSPLVDTRDIPRCYLHPYQTEVAILDSDHCTTTKNETDYQRVKSPECKTCIFNNECIGVWREYGELYSDLDLNPVT